jgi:hypothetical protein
MSLRPALVALLFCVPLYGHAASFEDTMKKLDPEERAHQACILKGLAAVRADKKLPGADRMKTSIFGRAQFVDGTQVKAKGGAVRAKDHWYALKFDCVVTADQMTATSFRYELGQEIPKTEWEDLGLWQ